VWPFSRRQAVPLEEQLAVLAACGIRPRPGVTAESLLRAVPPGTYESKPYVPLLSVLGAEEEDPGLGWHSDDVLFVDTECIQDHGDYARIAERMRVLSRGALPLEAVRDYVDLGAGEAWLEFELDGERQRWQLEVDDDWVDPAFFSRFAALLKARGAGRRYTSVDMGGQTFLVGCSTEAELRVLRERTGLDVEWLE